MAYTLIDDPSAHFQAFTYTGIQTNQSITLDGNSDLQPDLYWYKARNTNYHYLVDSSRGTTKYLYPNDSLVEGTVASSYVTSFDTNGVTLGGGDSGTNTGSVSFANWAWKANGGTTVSNTDGSITSTVQVNQDAGFSIVTFTSASSGVFSVGHGLGVTPDFIITKNRDGTGNWYVWHKDLSSGTTSLVSLNRTDAEENYGNAWGAGFTSSVFGMQSGNTATASNAYIAYVFADVQGYSKFGKYVGNGARNGVFVYTGFQPAFVMIKCSSAAGGRWTMFDNKRTIANGDMDYLVADADHAESDAGLGYTDPIDLVSNGFKIRNSDLFTNQSGTTYIYMAFAESSFVTSTGIPTTAR